MGLGVGGAKILVQKLAPPTPIILAIIVVILRAEKTP